VGRFYLRRVTRLEPPYIIALLLFYAAAVVLQTEDARAPGFFSGLLLRLGYLHSLIRNMQPTLDGVTWTLEIEVQFYLLAPLLAQVFRLSPRLRRLLLVAIIGGAPLLAGHIPRSSLTLPGYIQFFIAGFLLADLHTTSKSDRRQPHLYDMIGLTSLMAAFLLPDGKWFNMLFPWLLGLLFLGALRGGWLTAILRYQSVAVLGGMCYSLYLLHYPLYSFIAGRIITGHLSLAGACLRLGVAALPLAVAAGVAYYLLIERPCMNPNWPKQFYQRVRQLLGLPSPKLNEPNTP
jgi:peptidoglycan/LPS O-acetylase OafA/YrhL